ncbi:MAG: BON domain-containing protein [bacterium]|jgi:hyperosmotically inducible protein|nr:BON domain-containing protein [bacterium]MDD3804707.1 BON domain-containing protein [bacterium]MDD4152559.1 BON domain-containing protein [bacterium]
MSLDDLGINAKVKAKIAADDQLDIFDINVDTEDGIVYLRGIVDTLDNRDRVSELAWDVDGVEDVVNEVIVR